MRRFNSAFLCCHKYNNYIPKSNEKNIDENTVLSNSRLTSTMHRFSTFSICLFIILLIGGSMAFFLSMRDIIRDTKRNDLSQMVEIERNKLEASVNNEISLVLTLGSSPLIQSYFKTPDDISLSQRANKEILAYRNAFLSNSIFWVNDIDRMFFYNDDQSYYMDPELPENYWYNMTLYETEVYNFNINYNPDINETNLWINVPVFNEQHNPLGMVGTSIDVTTFITSIYADRSGPVDLYFFNTAGEVTGAMDINLVTQKININDQLSEHNIDIIENAKRLKGRETISIDMNDGNIIIGKVPSLDWYTVAVWSDSLADYDSPLTIFFMVVIIVIGVTIIFFNIIMAGLHRPLKQTMSDLEIAKNEAEEANRSKTSFLATISHEIRTPMNAIIGIAEIQLQRNEISNDFKTALDKIHVSAINLLGIINDILDMSKIETGKLDLNPLDYNTPSLINDAVQLNIVRIASKPIEFIVDVDDDLPSRMYGDELRLKQILNNLLSNAIKYSEKGYVKLTVSHTCHDDDIQLRFSIEDTGQGMRSQDMSRLFSEYIRFNTGANRTTEGTGLGLSITKRLVDMMDGEFDVQSEYGKGSIFTVTVLQKKIDCAPIGIDVAEKLRNFTYISEERHSFMQISHEIMPYGKVLIVDDVETNLYVAEGLMSNYKLQIETTTSGFNTIEKIKNGEVYDIIFMDHMMPKIDGIETTKLLREYGYSGTIVALTANAIVGNEELFIQNGFDGFISKPIDVKQLNIVLNTFIKDKYPEEAMKYKTQKSEQIKHSDSIGDSNYNNISNQKLIRVFVRDAINAINLLKTNLWNDDAKLYTTTVHAMKSALANINENELSNLAYELEKASKDNNSIYIADNSDIFTNKLEVLANKLNSLDDKDSDIIENSDKDFTLLNEQLIIIREACQNYDEQAALDSLKLLMETPWNSETKSELELFYDMLFLHSDFDSVIERINKKCLD